MDTQNFADTYIVTNKNFFPDDNINIIHEKLLHLPESKHSLILAMPLKNPFITLALSLFLGTLGADRFYLGDIGLGILKIVSVLIIVGWLWVLLDIYFCYKKTKQINFKNMMQII